MKEGPAVEMDSEYEFHANKRTDKLYVSPRIAGVYRIASKVIDSDLCFSHTRELGEVVLRVTHGGRQEIVAKFVEYGRDLYTLTFQRWNVINNVPYDRVHFSFSVAEIEKLRNFLDSINFLHFRDEKKVNVKETDLRLIDVSDELARKIILDSPDLIKEIIQNDITEQDIVALGYRRKQLEYFENLLFTPGYFASEHERIGGRPEDVWQKFFEGNHWIFGYGLSYVFLSSFDEEKLEQTVRGYSIASSGKRVDGLMKSNALIQSLCFVEVKRHDTELLAGRSYRPGVWRPSDDLTGGVAQLQETIRGATETIHERFVRDDENGEPTGEELFNIHPRSFLVIGCLGQLQGQHGTNVQKYRAFESYRRNIVMPEVVTFDELYYRAKYIVEQKKAENATPYELPDDMPF